MQFLTSLSSSEILVSVAFTLFAVLVISSICLRLRNNSRARKSVPNRAAKHGFRGFMSPNTDKPQVEIPEENFDRIYPARPKVRDDRSQPLTGADEVTLEDVASIPGILGSGDSAEQVAHAGWSDAEDGTAGNTYDDYQDNSPAWLDEGRTAVATSSMGGNGGYASDRYGQNHPANNDVDGNVANMGDSDYYEDQPEEAAVSNGDWDDNPNAQWQRRGFDQADDYSQEPNNNEYSEQSTESSYSQAKDGAEFNNEYAQDDIYPAARPELVNSQSASEVAVASKMKQLSHDVQRVGSTQHENERPNLTVVSICLVSNFDNRVFRDVSGDRLASFLNNRGFIFLDGEYHLKSTVTREGGVVRVRNLEPTPIGDLVRSNDYTRGFRMYFRPAEDPDPVATLNEMLKIAQSATGYFVDVGGMPLQIYHGLQKIKPLTQEDYEELRSDLRTAFPRSSSVLSSNRTQMSHDDFSVGDQLVSQANAY